jgi:tRNA G26 N,N-dimethylase Trm1
MEELSLRLILASINREANKLGKAIKPLLSLRKNFYLRVGSQMYNADIR